jgi:DNA-binding NtrC family response regulator
MSSPTHKIMVIDDEIGQPGGDHQLEFLKRAGRPAGDFVFSSGQDDSRRNDLARVLEEVRELWTGSSPSRLSLVLVDVRFRDRAHASHGDRFGLEILRALRHEFGRALPVVMLTSVGEVSEEANALEVDDFLPKESLTPDTLHEKVLARGLYPAEDSGILGTSPAFLLALRELRRCVAGGHREMLLLGETGTGKSELARYFHKLSKRTGRLEVWYGRRTTAELHRDELFGHWAGAFYGAAEHRAGAAERAHGGTLLLDEIGDLSPAGQTELLEYRQRSRVDGFRRIKRLGNAPARAGNPSRAAALDLYAPYSEEEDRVLVDTSLVAATLHPIDDERWRSANGFRDDLYNRLGHRIRLPPLRARVEDIVPLFLARATGLAGRDLALSSEARDLLESRSWSEGNLAELTSAAERAVSQLGSHFDTVHARHIGPPVQEHEPRPVVPAAQPSTGPRSGPRAGDFAGIELQALMSLTDLLRTAVVETCRPTGLGSLTDIMKYATGVEYPATDVQRELRTVLTPWFEPTKRQLVRWPLEGAYGQFAQRVRGDAILEALYKYSVEILRWEQARQQIMAALES